GRVRRVHPRGEAVLVLGLVGPRRGTQQTVAALRERASRWPNRYARLFREVGRVVLEGTRALEAGDLEALGDAMNVNHGLLAAMGVSSPPLHGAGVALPRARALGSTLTGAGGDGGAVVALCGAPPRDRKALERWGRRLLLSRLGRAG